jgi:hypothetical protein
MRWASHMTMKNLGFRYNTGPRLGPTRPKYRLRTRLIPRVRSTKCERILDSHRLPQRGEDFG